MDLMAQYRYNAGLQQKDVSTFETKSKDELLALKSLLEGRIKRSFVLAESKLNDQIQLQSVNAALKKLDDQIDEHLEEVNGKWALVSKKTGKPLRYYKGEGKPSAEWVGKQEKSIQYFKNMGEGAELPQDDEDTEVVSEAEQPTSGSPTVPEVDYATTEKETPQIEPLQMNIEQDEQTPVKLPAGMMAAVDKRIAELQKSMDEFDKEEFKIHYHNKQKAIDCLEFLKEKLGMGNMVGFKQAIVFYGTVASFISEMFPAKLVQFLHSGMAQKNEEPTGSAPDGTPDKLKNKDIPLRSNVPPTDTTVYPQKPKSKDTPD